MLKKIIHIFFLPCSKATLLMEKRNAKSISPKENWQLSMHVKICKWCKAYQKKVEILDSILKKKWFEEEEVDINTAEIQSFKDKVFRKLDF
ncbi:hypothetical protein [Chryseobacterium indoltheticum]|uniref:Zf-HC2 domain-containing protein n=1 Tax=Chryseobacterium indoltheticum TaxID=254 RepID=A0A381FD30_9FLAO|nr:hypothetical protein [Chryseobacterium indoltheticum]AZA73984.1 hypothetical protein EG358_09575 [Chryseobacterium indoltheticum]SIQ24939.1 hypothetical protein SAMN05421682_103303 [Chryseobacterium indoltheticum]SUX44439.1 Uncharacterised protein [Chryseobacterium indoltheticum]